MAEYLILNLNLNPSLKKNRRSRKIRRKIQMGQMIITEIMKEIKKAMAMDLAKAREMAKMTASHHLLAEKSGICRGRMVGKLLRRNWNRIVKSGR